VIGNRHRLFRRGDRRPGKVKTPGGKRLARRMGVNKGGRLGGSVGRAQAEGGGWVSVGGGRGQGKRSGGVQTTGEFGFYIRNQQKKDKHCVCQGVGT